MQTAQVFIVLGALLSIFLAINAYFIRELVQSIQSVQVNVAGSVAELTEKYKSADKRICKNDEDIEMLRERSHKVVSEVQSVILKVELVKNDVDNLKNRKG